MLKCDADDNLTATFQRAVNTGLLGSTTYYLRIEGTSTTAKSSTYSMTISIDDWTQKEGNWIVINISRLGIQEYIYIFVIA